MAKRRKAAPRRRSYGGRVKRTRGNKKTAWKMIKGVVYGGAIALPAYNTYSYLRANGRDAQGAAIGTISSFAGIDPNTNKFDSAALVTQYTPIVTVAVVDWITTKIPVQRAISRGLRNLF